MSWKSEVSLPGLFPFNLCPCATGSAFESSLFTTHLGLCVRGNFSHCRLPPSYTGKTRGHSSSSHSPP